MAAGKYVWTGLDSTSAVLPITGDGVHMVVGLATIVDAGLGDSVAGCVW